MPDGVIRLLNSLRPLARGPDSWLSRSPSCGEKRPSAEDSAAFDKALAGKVHDLRRAFPLADASTIEALATICCCMSVPGGGALMLEGEQPEAVYIVVAGLFASYRAAGIGRDGPVDRFGAGDVIGDIGFITGDARAFSIRALRNSEVLRCTKQDLLTMATRCPGVLLAISAGVIQRLQRAQLTSVTSLKCRTFCLLPVDSGIDIKPIVEKMAETLAGFGTVTIVSAEQRSARTPAWFSEVERGSDYVLLQAECGATAWTRFCLRQCDRIVLLARGDSEPDDRPGFEMGRLDVPQHTPLSLMLLWQEGILPGRTTAWMNAVKPVGHYHIRSPRDIQRASRLIAGRGRGLVLSGGGAKALAHVGVINALRQNDIDIDAIGGTSIGGIVAAVFALEWDLAATVGSLAAAFGRRRFSDFAVPRTALYSERAFARTLGHCFAGLAVEDAPIPLFCVSTNLTEGVSTVHRSGRLVTWLRATSAVPGICPPIIEQNAVYVDGGVLDNMPIDAVRDFGVASVIAVDVGSSLEAQARSDGDYGLPNIVDLLWRVGTIGSDSAANRAPRDGDVVLRPEMGKIGLFEWTAHERAIAAGHQAVLENLNDIRAALGRVC